MFKFALLAFFALAFFACNPSEYEPRIVLGHEWNATAKVVADTTSKFRPKDIIVIQMDNGNRPFHTTEVELRIYQGEIGNRILFKRAIPVKNVDSKAVAKGTDSKPLTAKEILRTSTAGTYRVAFAIGDSILLQKKLELLGPKINFGHGWNAIDKVITDTTSRFKPNDIIAIQMENDNKPFNTKEVELRIYQDETGDKILVRRSIPVKSDDIMAVAKGTDSKPLTAKELMGTTASGIYRVAFAVGNSVIVERRMELISGK